MFSSTVCTLGKKGSAPVPPQPGSIRLPFSSSVTYTRVLCCNFAQRNNRAMKSKQFLLHKATKNNKLDPLQLKPPPCIKFAFYKVYFLRFCKMIKTATIYHIQTIRIPQRYGPQIISTYLASPSIVSRDLSIYQYNQLINYMPFLNSGQSSGTGQPVFTAIY